MLELTLAEQIYSFISNLRVVNESQIYKFFRKEPAAAIKSELQNMIVKSRVFTIAPGILCCQRKLLTTVADYTDTLRAIDVMCELTSKDITWFSLGEFPTDLMFIEHNMNLYDVVVFNEYNINAKSALLSMYRKQQLPNHLEDPFNHIAVVKDEAMFRSIEHLGWKMFATITPSGFVQMYDFEE